MKTKLSVLILHNDVSETASIHPSRYESVKAVLSSVAFVEQALKKLGIKYRIASVRTIEDVPGAVSAGLEQVIFNLVEELEGPLCDVSSVPAICRSLGRECTGGATWCLSLTTNKAATKAILRERGINVPPGIVVFPGEDSFPHELLKDRVIVKPINLDGSEGISSSSVICGDRNAIHNAVQLIYEKFKQPSLVERYIDGREINVPLMEYNGERIILPLTEIDFGAFPPGKPRIVCYSAKWLVDSFEYRNTPHKVSVELTPEQEKVIREIALKVWDITECSDYARIDMRLDAEGKVYVLEVNSNPDLSPDAGFYSSLQAAGITFENFVEKILTNAFARYQTRILKHENVKTLRNEPASQIIIRESIPDDKAAILKLVADTGVFRPDEITVAAEVLDISLTSALPKEYESLTCEIKGQVVGWLCWGAASCCFRTYEIYWLVVAPQFQRMKIGKKLLEHAENLIRNKGGRLVVIETSSRSDYQKARNFYARMGYLAVANIPEFFAPHDDKVVYMKKLDISTTDSKKGEQ